MIIVVMGVAGSGKTTIGRRLAEAIGAGFSDADDFHSAESVSRMRQGIALTDADRDPWLHAIRRSIDEKKRTGESHVFACSALKARHREVLGAGDPRVRFVYLKGDADLIRERLSGRTGHFFDPALLESQFAALEAPREALTVDIARAPGEIVGEIVAALEGGR